MKKETGIIAGVIALITGTIAFIERKKKKKEKTKKTTETPNAEFMKNYIEFSKLSLQSSENAETAIKMMNYLQKELDEKYGIDPNTINTYIEDTLKEEAT